jgi:hypothetical protein
MKLLRPLKSAERRGEALVSSADCQSEETAASTARQLVAKFSILDIVTCVSKLALGEYGKGFVSLALVRSEAIASASCHDLRWRDLVRARLNKIPIQRWHGNFAQSAIHQGKYKSCFNYVVNESM